MSDYRIPANFKRVVVGFYSNSTPEFCGIAFYDKNGNEMFKRGNLDNYKVETTLDDDERLVGIALRTTSSNYRNDF